MVHIQSITDAKNLITTAERGGLKAFHVHPNMVLKDRVLVVLGNSPALNKVNLTLLDKVATIGINRIGRVYTPDALLFTDMPILTDEDAYYKAFKGPILTWQNFEKSWIQGAPNARYFNLAPVTPIESWIWPKKPEDPLIREGTTTAYAIQLAILHRVRAVAILGVDFSAPSLNLKSQPSHFYGDGFKMGSSGGMGWEKHHQTFYSAIPKWAASFGVEAINLSPFDDTPINRAGWTKMTLEKFVESYIDPLKGNQK